MLTALNEEGQENRSLGRQVCDMRNRHALSSRATIGHEKTDASTLMPRATHTARPLEGDYILSFTGITWSVLRSTGELSATSIASGVKDRKTALARIRTLTEHDGADGWEADGRDLFRQITRFRR